MSATPLRDVLGAAERELAAAGVASPRVDAELLAAHALDVPRSRLPLVTGLDDDVCARLRTSVARRAAREPLQHILGTAVLGPVTVDVGPGVFVPRPETELLLEWGLGVLRGVAEPVVVDLCTGSGALALAFAASRPDASVHAVEREQDAACWARRNVAGSGVTLHVADVGDPGLLEALDGVVDLLVCNPPYVPDGTAVPPEVAAWDPPGAVFGGPDGTGLIDAVARAAVRLLRPGGALAVEHDDTHAETVPALLRRHGLVGVADHDDLAGRPRFATARRTGARAPDALS